jgi:hypothetical protein
VGHIEGTMGGTFIPLPIWAGSKNVNISPTEFRASFADLRALGCMQVFFFFWCV